jgi:hypothetical protein
MRSGPLAAAVCGEQVRLALVEARPAGLHLRQLVPARARRNARDYERLAQHSEAHITWAAVTLMTRRLSRRRPKGALLHA